jgi:ABC-type uncharacterized transport system ATPase subunit
MSKTTRDSQTGSYIICKNLSLAYDGYSAVRGINFSVDRGDYL